MELNIFGVVLICMIAHGSERMLLPYSCLSNQYSTTLLQVVPIGVVGVVPVTAVVAVCRQLVYLANSRSR